MYLSYNKTPFCTQETNEDQALLCDEGLVLEVGNPIRDGLITGGLITGGLIRGSPIRGGLISVLFSTPPHQTSPIQY